MVVKIIIIVGGGVYLAWRFYLKDKFEGRFGATPEERAEKMLSSVLGELPTPMMGDIVSITDTIAAVTGEDRRAIESAVLEDPHTAYRVAKALHRMREGYMPVKVVKRTATIVVQEAGGKLISPETAEGLEYQADHMIRGREQRYKALDDFS